MTFSTEELAETGIRIPPGWNPSRRPRGDRPKTAAERQAAHREAQRAITTRLFYQARMLHQERVEFDKRFGAGAADAVLRARSRRAAVAALRKLVEQLEEPESATTP